MRNSKNKWFRKAADKAYQCSKSTGLQTVFRNGFEGPLSGNRPGGSSPVGKRDARKEPWNPNPSQPQPDYLNSTAYEHCLTEIHFKVIYRAARMWAPPGLEVRTMDLRLRASPEVIKDYMGDLATFLVSERDSSPSLSVGITISGSIFHRPARTPVRIARLHDFPCHERRTSTRPSARRVRPRAPTFASGFLVSRRARDVQSANAPAYTRNPPLRGRS